MVKRELFKDEFDLYGDVAEQDVNSPKRAKKELKHQDFEFPEKKVKRTTAGQIHRGWTKKEEEGLMDCLHGIIVAGMSQAIKDYPILASRKAQGCIRHWTSIRRNHEIGILGAATVDKNGRKLPKQQIEDAMAKQEEKKHE